MKNAVPHPLHILLLAIRISLELTSVISIPYISLEDDLIVDNQSFEPKKRACMSEWVSEVE
jgi:hypothetical protein